MPLHVDTTQGFLLYTSARRGPARREGQVLFPATDTVGDLPASPACENPLPAELHHGHVLLRSVRLARLAQKLQRLASLFRSSPPVPRREACAPRALLSPRVPVLVGISAWAAGVAPPLRSKALETPPDPPSFAGYDFRRPFRFDVFWRKKVPESTPYAMARTLRLPELPTLAFLKMPSDVVIGEGVYLLTRNAWVDVLTWPKGALLRHRLSPIGRCGLSNLFATPVGAALLVAGDVAKAHHVLVAPHDLDVLCAQARVVTENAR